VRRMREEESEGKNVLNDLTRIGVGVSDIPPRIWLKPRYHLGGYWNKTTVIFKS